MAKLKAFKAIKEKWLGDIAVKKEYDSLKEEFRLAEEIIKAKLKGIANMLIDKDEPKEKIFKLVEKVWDKNKNIDPGKLEKLVEKAVKSIRATKTK